MSYLCAPSLSLSHSHSLFLSHPSSLPQLCPCKPCAVVSPEASFHGLSLQQCKWRLARMNASSLLAGQILRENSVTEWEVQGQRAPAPPNTKSTDPGSRLPSATEATGTRWRGRRSWRLWDVVMECVRLMTDKILKMIRVVGLWLPFSCRSVAFGKHCSLRFIPTAFLHSLKVPQRVYSSVLEPPIYLVLGCFPFTEQILIHTLSMYVI